jgi:hypothetical protein
LGRPHSRFNDTPCVLSRRRALLFCSICAALSRLNALCAPTHSSWSRRCCSPPLLPSPRSPPLFTSGLGTATLRAADRPRQCPARDASGNSASAISLIHPFTTHPAARSDPLPGVVLAASPPPPFFCGSSLRLRPFDTSPPPANSGKGNCPARCAAPDNQSSSHLSMRVAPRFLCTRATFLRSPGTPRFPLSLRHSTRHLRHFCAPFCSRPLPLSQQCATIYVICHHICSPLPLPPLPFPPPFAAAAVSP